MPLTQEGEARTKAGECRRCRTFCDKLIEPRDCIEMQCPYLYSYIDPLSGSRYMGCMQKVFRAEINIDLFEAAERTQRGYGGIKMTGEPLPHCQFRVEPSYEGCGPAYECVNPSFFDCWDGTSERTQDFDLRDALA